jgi:hypothetical protein
MRLRQYTHDDIIKKNKKNIVNFISPLLHNHVRNYLR